jgi:quinol-cytochrome oxidoreductase complex cytochrome b subunit
VVKSGSIQQTRAEAQDKVHTWPHLLVVEFASILIVTAALLIFSALVRAPLLGLADFNKTPNPSKAPWYFLGLQELLTMFNPQIAGVLVPGMGLILLMVAPFVDKNPSTKPKDRKFAIAIFTIFVMMWSVLVILGSFFRGPGFNFILPWKDGIFFEL